MALALCLSALLAPRIAYAVEVDTVLPPLTQSGQATVPSVPAASLDVYTTERRPSTDAKPDETAMWNALNAGQDDLFSELTMRAKRLYPQWQIPPSMLDAQQTHKTERKISETIASGDEWRILEIRETHPEFFDCNHEGNVWALYEAKKAAGDREDARQLLHLSVRRCPSAMRLTAIQKANEDFGKEEAVSLSTIPGSKSDGETRFIVMLTRAGSGKQLDAYGSAVRRIAAATNGVRRGAPIPQDIYVIQKIAGAHKDSGGAMAAGWWLLNSGRAAAAESAFRDALSWGGGDKAKAGIVYALVGQNKLDDADALAGQWRNAVPDYAGLRAGYAGKAVYAANDAKDYRRCVDEAGKPGVSELPRIRLVRGWCEMKLGNPEAALISFETAQKNAGDSQTKSDALKGRIAAAARLGRQDYLDHIQDDSSLDADEKRTLQSSLALSSFLTLYNQGQYRDAADAANRYETDGGKLDSGLQILLGWALYNGGRCDEARRHFAYLADNLPPGEDKRKAIDARRQIEQSLPYHNPFGCIDRTGTLPSEL